MQIKTTHVYFFEYSLQLLERVAVAVALAHQTVHRLVPNKMRAHRDNWHVRVPALCVYVAVVHKAAVAAVRAAPASSSATVRQADRWYRCRRHLCPKN